ncbi:hypothetical protein D3C81_2154230 [compost metagenome]
MSNVRLCLGGRKIINPASNHYHSDGFSGIALEVMTISGCLLIVIIGKWVRWPFELNQQELTR